MRLILPAWDYRIKFCAAKVYSGNRAMLFKNAGIMNKIAEMVYCCNVCDKMIA